MSAWDERVRRSVSLGQKLAPTTDSPVKPRTGVKMLEMIPGASGLQIECSLFLWLSSDVGKLLQVLVVPCIKSGKLDLVNGEIHHERAIQLNGVGVRDGGDDDRLRGLNLHGVGVL